ncbi:MAG: hypothetical protein LBM62_06250 [Mediterranea sp.]|jgi:hypothetical protein|nr:hypothetical protein [Mediterranea sp.]
MRTKIYFIGLLVLLAFTGCYNRELNHYIGTEDRDVPPTPILVNANTTSPGGQTRAPWDGNETTLSTTKKYDAYVLVSETNGDYTTLYTDDDDNQHNRVIWTDDIATRFSDASGAITDYYYSIDETIYLVGLYPYTTATTGGGWAQATAGTVTATTTAKGTFDGKTDLMYAHQVSANQDTSPTLTFDHLGTLLQFYLKAEDEAAVAEWGNITSITLTGMAGGMKNTTTVTFADATTSYGGTPTSMPVYGATYSSSAYSYTDVAYTGKDYELTTTATCQAYTIVPPVTSDAATGTAEYTLTINTVNATGAVVNLQLETTAAKSTKGNSYKVTLNFKETGEVGTEVSVLDWVPGTNVNQDVD